MTSRELKCKISKVSSTWILYVNGKKITEGVFVRLSRYSTGGYYVSFYYNAYRHWADHVQPGVEFIAKKTKEHQHGI